MKPATKIAVGPVKDCPDAVESLAVETPVGTILMQYRETPYGTRLAEVPGEIEKQIILTIRQQYGDMRWIVSDVDGSGNITPF